MKAKVKHGAASHAGERRPKNSRATGADANVAKMRLDAMRNEAHLFRIVSFAGETGHGAGAEGETAPETLRQKDREENGLWKEARRPGRRFVHRRA